MKKLHAYTLGLLAAILAIEATLFLLPVPDFVANLQTYKTSFLIVSLFSAFYFGAAVLFLYGITGFRPEMRKSYLIITASMAFFGIVNLQYPILIYAGLIPGVWTTYGGSLLIIVPGVIMHYWGIRHLAQTLGIKNAFMSLQVLAFVTLASCAITVFIPHLQEIPEFWFGVHQVATMSNLVINLFTAVILYKVIKIIGPTYLPSVRWFFAGVVLSVLGFLHVAVAALFGQNNPYTEQGTTALPFIFVAIMYFISGYYFCKIPFLGYSKTTSKGHDIIDAIITIASLVSYPKDIDAPLERMRNITARISPDQDLLEADENNLVKIYLDIEQYLINYEKLKNFTQESLRARLSVEAIRVIENYKKY